MNGNGRRTEVNLYLSNIPFRATRRDIFEYCAEVGEAFNVRIILDRMTRKPRGFAFATLLLPHGSPWQAGWEEHNEQHENERKGVHAPSQRCVICKLNNGFMGDRKIIVARGSDRPDG